MLKCYSCVFHCFSYGTFQIFYKHMHMDSAQLIRNHYC